MFKFSRQILLLRELSRLVFVTGTPEPIGILNDWLIDGLSNCDSGHLMAAKKLAGESQDCECVVDCEHMEGRRIRNAASGHSSDDPNSQRTRSASVVSCRRRRR